MANFKSRPRAQDNRNVSQGDIQGNFDYLANDYQDPVLSGVLPVDHQITGTNIGTTDGFHKQVSFLNRGATPANLTNAVNGQASNGILYTIADTEGNSELHFLNDNEQDFTLTNSNSIITVPDVAVVIGPPAPVYTFPTDINCFGWIYPINKTNPSIVGQPVYFVVFTNVLYLVNNTMTAGLNVALLSSLTYTVTGAPPLTLNVQANGLNFPGTYAFRIQVTNL
jgi:hypothetical protein